MLNTLCNFNEKEMRSMKAVVLDIKKNKAVALSDDGMVKEVNNKNFRIGQTIEMEKKSMKKMSKKYRNIAAGVAASLVILLGGGTAYAYNTPVAHVSLDVNPSITYSVNAFNRVIDVDRTNPDGEAILQTMVWDNENISDVIENTISALKEAKYLENDEWYKDSMIIGVNATSKDKENQLILAIKNELAKFVAEDTDKEIVAADLDETVIKHIIPQIKANRIAARSTTTQALDAIMTEDDSDNNSNGNANNNGNGNINNNGNANVDDVDLDENTTEIEKVRNENANENANENSISHGAIETEND